MTASIRSKRGIAICAALFIAFLAGCGGTSTTQALPGTGHFRRPMTLLSPPTPGSIYVVGQGYFNRYDPPYSTSNAWTYNVSAGDAATFGRVAEGTQLHTWVDLAELPASTSAGVLDVFNASTAGGLNDPKQSVSGPSTGLIQPSGVAIDQNGAPWVTDASSDAISVFSLVANGDSAPTNVISGSNTMLSQPYKDAFDASGILYVANHSAPGGILLFPQSATGNAAPTAVLFGSSWAGASTYGTTWSSLAIRNDGSMVVIPAAHDNEVLTFAPNPTDSSMPTAVLTPKCSCHFVDVAIDDDSNVYALSNSNTGYGVWKFTWGATGTGGVRSPVLPVQNAVGLVVYRANPTY